MLILELSDLFPISYFILPVASREYIQYGDSFSNKEFNVTNEMEIFKNACLNTVLRFYKKNPKTLLKLFIVI